MEGTVLPLGGPTAGAITELGYSYGAVTYGAETTTGPLTLFVQGPGTAAVKIG